MPTLRSATSGKERKTYADPPKDRQKTKRRPLPHAHHLAMARLHAVHGHIVHAPEYKGIDTKGLRNLTAAHSGLSAVRMLKRGGTRRNRKRTMRW